jgi:hypothetical protein
MSMKIDTTGNSGAKGLPHNPYKIENKQHFNKVNEINTSTPKIHNVSIPVISMASPNKITSIIAALETYVTAQGYGDVSRCLSNGKYTQADKPKFDPSKNDGHNIYRNNFGRNGNRNQGNNYHDNESYYNGNNNRSNDYNRYDNHNDNNTKQTNTPHYYNYESYINQINQQSRQTYGHDNFDSHSSYMFTRVVDPCTQQTVPDEGGNDASRDSITGEIALLEKNDRNNLCSLQYQYHIQDTINDISLLPSTDTIVQFCQYIDDVILTNGIEHTASPEEPIQYPTLHVNLQGQEQGPKVSSIDSDNDKALELMIDSDDEDDVLQLTIHPSHQYPSIMFDPGVSMAHLHVTKNTIEMHLPRSLIQDPDSYDPDLGGAAAIGKEELSRKDMVAKGDQHYLSHRAETKRMGFEKSDAIISNSVAVIFDSGGTATIISNSDLLDKIRPTTPTHLNGIGGAHMVDIIGDPPGIGVAHYSPRLNINIVSLSQCRGNGHTVHFEPGPIPSEDSFHLITSSFLYVFKKQQSGLFIC